MRWLIKLLLFSFCLITIYPLLAKELIIENVTLISAERFKPLERANVRINDGKIIEVSFTALTASNSSQKIDATGQYLIPGLMDSHVHVTNMPGLLLDENSSDELQKLHSDYLKQQPRSYLYFGVTQLVDPSQSQAAISAFNQATTRPDLLHCGATPIIGGYPTIWSSEGSTVEFFDYFIIDDQNNQKIPQGIDPKQHTPEAVVKRMAEDGAICVKVFIEDGFGADNSWPLISNLLIERVKLAAKKHGLILMAHANAIDMQEIAQKLAVDVIAHGMWNWNQFDGAPGLPDEIKTILDKIIQQKIVLQPTLNVMDGLKGVTVPNILSDPLYAKVISKAAMQWYATDAGLWFRNESLEAYGGGSAEGIKLDKIHARQDRIISQGERVVAYLNEQGHPLVLASDTPSSPTFAAQPGYSTFMELKHLAKIGVPLNNIFAAATINNALAFGLDKKYGSIEPGKIANLLLLNANPLETIEAYNQIDKVIIRGEVFDREIFAVEQ